MVVHYHAFGVPIKINSTVVDKREWALQDVLGKLSSPCTKGKFSKLGTAILLTQASDPTSFSMPQDQRLQLSLCPTNIKMNAGPIALHSMQGGARTVHY